MSSPIKREMVNECLNLVRLGNREKNKVRYSEGEGKKHIAIKEAICEKLEKDGHEYITEAIFRTGGRADILVLDEFKVIEVAVSESESSLNEKAKHYPKGIKMQVVRG